MTAAAPFGRLNEDFTTVAAIDFGTTFSGYAFSFKADPDNLHHYTSWGARSGIPFSPKTPTCVLTNNENQFVSMGYEAKQKMDEMLPEEYKSYRLYDRFKMQLHNPKEKLTVETTVKDLRGNECRALDIFVMVLKQLKKNIYEEMKAKNQSATNDRDMRWVITVPAIWSDAAKQFMKEATIKSGLALDKDASNIVIALEPEAASLYCKSLPNAEYAAAEGDFSLVKGDKYLVLDFGGGTLDITCHEILHDERIAELHHANGGAMGAARVDAEFIKLLDRIFRMDFSEFLKKENPNDYDNLISSFELQKRTFKEADEPVSISVTYSFAELYREQAGKTLDEDITAEYAKKGVRVVKGKIIVPNTLIADCFRSVTDEIKKYVGDLLKEAAMKNVNKILMVGGFSASPFLQAVIRKAFGQKYKVLIPKHAWSAVVRGAVKFGHNPGAVCVRKAKLTYGIGSYVEYDPKKHSNDRVKDINGNDRVWGFNVFVKKGGDIKIDHSVKKNFCPIKSEQEEIEFGIFTSEKEEPLYLDEAGVKEVGKVTVSIGGSGLDREVETSMCFGGTDISVTSRDLTHGGEDAVSKVDFL